MKHVDYNLQQRTLSSLPELCAKISKLYAQFIEIMRHENLYYAQIMRSFLKTKLTFGH